MRWAVLGLAMTRCFGGGEAAPDPSDAAQVQGDGPVAAGDEIAPPPLPPAPAPCPEGVVEIPMWQGEYPAPVIHVKSGFEVPAFPSPCAPAPTARCFLEPAVYHPWGAGAAYVTTRGVDRHKALKELTLDAASGPLTVPAGSIVPVVAYGGEGYCGFRWEGQDASAMCPGMEEGLWEDLPDPEVPERQLFDPGCAAWVLVEDALMGRAEVAVGEVITYGEVGPSR
jgi:hypothetical protein